MKVLRQATDVATRLATTLILTAISTFAQVPWIPGPCPSGANCNTIAPCGSGCIDLDHDALCDSWEVAGGIDLNFDGRINEQHDLLLPDADPNRPDIYLQYDWMQPGGRGKDNHRPSLKAIQAVVDAFARQGVALHTFPGRPVPHYSVITFQEVVSSCAGDDAVNFHELKSRYFDSHRSVAYHYAVFGHYLTCDSIAHCSDCPAIDGQPAIFGATGQADLPGNDLIVTWGGLLDFGDAPTVSEQASVFMHELGHNLRLQHGGAFGLPSNKPNYLSVVNGSFAFTGIPIASAPGGMVPIDCEADADCPADAICATRGNYCTRIDYSRSALPDLDELSLNEVFGIGAGTNDITNYLCPDQTQMFASASGPIDWNCNGINNELNVVSDINADSAFNFLLGHRDWGNLMLHFQCVREGANLTSEQRLSDSEPSFLNVMRGLGGPLK